MGKGTSDAIIVPILEVKPPLCQFIQIGGIHSIDKFGPMNVMDCHDLPR